MKDRIKHLRKDLLKMTLEQFGSKIGMKKNSISQIENGINSATDQVVRAICREFNVREEWLRSGDGDPFVQTSRDEQIEKMVNEIMRDKPESFKRRYITALASLDEDGWAALERFVDSIIEVSKEMPQPAAAHDDIDNLPPDEQELLRQYREKKNQVEGSSASSAG